MDAFGSLEAEERLNEDAAGEYWRAFDRNLDRKCLVRLHLDAEDATAEPVELQRLRFIAAARALAGIDHANVARILDYGVADDGRPFMVHPFYPQRLSERLADAGPLPLHIAARYLDEVCAGLAAAHAASVTHGALTPAEIFLCDIRPHVRLVGFYGDVGRSDRRRPGPADDIRQLGRLAYRLLSGQAATEDAPPLRDRNPALPPGLTTWTMDCLAADAARRPASAATARASLRDAVAA